MLGKVALLTVALMLLGATVGFAGREELDSNPTPSDLVLSKIVVPVYFSTSVWPGTIGDTDGRDNADLRF